MLPVVVALLGRMLWRGNDRVAARKLLIATVVGILAFVPWLQVFLYQSEHTGTPWGTAVLPSLPYGYTLRDFAGGATFGTEVQEGWLLFVVMFVLWFLGIFGKGIDERRIEVDLVPRKDMRAIAFMGVVGLAVALSLDYLAGGAFQSRYGSIVFPFFVILAARGHHDRVQRARSDRDRGGARRARVRRRHTECVHATHAGRRGRGGAATRGAVRATSSCTAPTRSRPPVHRLAPAGLDEIVYPSAAGPERIDWVDYKARLRKANVGAFATAALARAGSHNLWYVRAPGYADAQGRLRATRC